MTRQVNIVDFQFTTSDEDYAAFEASVVEFYGAGEDAFVEALMEALGMWVDETADNNAQVTLTVGEHSFQVPANTYAIFLDCLKGDEGSSHKACLAAIRRQLSL